ncbi:unnamed protein product [Spirodela intermedia]|uniref:Uncharacterized protein n=1 Tax=Spirodela intermedia TaxID=51605 RepID=A0A7I8ILD4_SPIIN|nr:unnamed protein product [Spirodela intermedia]CAA6657751.1 unnamed protein product [Spirodela intermedia]
MEKLTRRMLPVGTPIAEAEAEDCSFAEEYDGPPISYEIPRPSPLRSITSPSLPYNSSGVLGCSPSVPDRSRELSDGVLEAVGFSTEFKESVDFSNGTDARVDQVTTGSGLSSDDFGFPSSGSDDDDQEMAVAPPEEYAKRGPQVSFQDSEVERLTSHGETASGQQELWEGSNPRVKKGSCYRCHRGNRFTEKEVCLVCDAKYCSSCLLKAMGSMPEGRKCVTCIGFPIDETKRDSLGKCSRILKKLLSSLEVQQVMKAEKKQLSQDEMILLQSSPNPPTKLKPGYYWYDKVSGFWGKEGHKPHKIISPHLNVGGNLMPEASNGTTGVFINNREITKTELRMLQWAGVQCAGCPHFWVNADGTYQEEGQKNIKGHLWGKAGMKLVCSILSLPTPCKEIVTSRDEVNNMTNRPIPDYFEQRTLQKLLLIGYHQSGTSTIFKQAKFLYKTVPFTEGECESIKLLIQSNIYKYLGILLEGRKRFEEESLTEITRKHNESDGGKCKTLYSIGPRLKAFSDWLLKVMESGNLEAIFPAATREYAPLVEELWKDAAIQATYNRRSELQLLPSSASYFLERAVDISRAEYEPSQLDILYADGITSSNGLACTEFIFPPSAGTISGFDGEEHHEALIRAGENYKWLEMFEDVRLVVFCVSMSDYDEYSEDATGVPTNKIHPTFEQMDFLLVLTKYDLLERKIEQSPLTLCDWFKDFEPPRPQQPRHLAATAGLHYIAVKFKRLFSSLTGRKLYVTAGNGLDPDSTDRALRYTREILMWEEERLMFGSDDLEAGSTVPSSFSQ